MKYQGQRRSASGGAWQRAGPAGRTTCAAVRLWGAEEQSPYGSEELELRI